MNVFLPYPDFETSVRCLDHPRLTGQRKECLQLLLRQWKNHPASKMWLPKYEYALLQYSIEVSREWIRRGHTDNLLSVFTRMLCELPADCCRDMPHWLGDKDVHDGYKSNLMRKNPDHYSQFNWIVPETLPYKWKV